MKRTDIHAGVEYAMLHPSDTRSQPTLIIVVDPGNFEDHSVRNSDGSRSSTIIPEGGNLGGMRWSARTNAKGVLAAVLSRVPVRDEEGEYVTFTTKREALAAYSHLPRGTVDAYVRWSLRGGKDEERWAVSLAYWEPTVVPRNMIRSTWADHVASERQRKQLRMAEDNRKARAEAEYDAWLDEALPVIERLNALGDTVRAKPAEGSRLSGGLPPKNITLTLDLDTALALLWRWDAAPPLTIPGGPS